jgi:hypothetical protein
LIEAMAGLRFSPGAAMTILVKFGLERRLFKPAIVVTDGGALIKSLYLILKKEDVFILKLLLVSNFRATWGAGLMPG